MFTLLLLCPAWTDCVDIGRHQLYMQFMKRDGIKYIHSAPYHPASNGLAESFVQPYKCYEGL